MTNRELPIENKDKIIKWDKTKIKSDAVVIMIIASVLSLLTPFGMDKVGLIKGWFFWLLLCFSGYFVYAPIIYFGNEFLYKMSKVLRARYWLRITLLAALGSVIMSFIVPLVVINFFDVQIAYLTLVPQIMLRTFIVGGLISGVYSLKNYLQTQNQQLLKQQQQLSAQQAQNSNSINKKYQDFMTKLPLDKRGKLICLEMDDHYLKVHTDKGSDLILMRFKDALACLDEYPGIQTHRSWWVAQDAIVSEEKEGRKLLLKLVNQQLVPVSRRYTEQVKTLIQQLVV